MGTVIGSTIQQNPQAQTQLEYTQLFIFTTGLY